jgi:uncharacterized metal-binding protein YceD (DUF177 family)
MKATEPVSTQLPFSRPFKVEEAGDRPVEIDIVADEAARSAVAKQAGIPALGSLKARLRIEALRRGRIEVTGELTATPSQICGVTLEPFENEVREQIEAVFAPEKDAEKAAARFASRPEDADDEASSEEPPDPIIDGRIDLGQLVVEFFVLGLDPYPRKPGVAFEAPVVVASDIAEESPFAALAKLKQPKGE